MITFELVSPEKKLFAAPVAMVTLPGTEGDFGVLEGHAPFISTMRVGIIDVYEQENTITRRIMVSGGLVEVNPERCTVLAQEATPMEEITRESLEAELKKHQDSLQIAANDDEREKVQEKIALTQAKLTAIGAAAH